MLWIVCFDVDFGLVVFFFSICCLSGKLARVSSHPDEPTGPGKGPSERLETVAGEDWVGNPGGKGTWEG